jgi:hypothetical protein
MPTVAEEKYYEKVKLAAAWSLTSGNHAAAVSFLKNGSTY